MSILKGVYTGPRKELKGHYALLRPTRGGNWVAQLDSTNLAEAFGWHFFLRKHFTVITRARHRRSMSLAQRRARERMGVEEFVATMRKWDSATVRGLYARRFSA